MFVFSVHLDGCSYSQNISTHHLLIHASRGWTRPDRAAMTLSPEEEATREKNVYLAKLAEQSERYDEMAA